MGVTELDRGHGDDAERPAGRDHDGWRIVLRNSSSHDHRGTLAQAHSALSHTEGLAAMMRWGTCDKCCIRGKLVTVEHAAHCQDDERDWQGRAKGEQHEYGACRSRKGGHPPLTLRRSDKPAEHDSANRSAKRSGGQ